MTNTTTAKQDLVDYLLNVIAQDPAVQDYATTYADKTVGWTLEQIQEDELLRNQEDLWYGMYWFAVTHLLGAVIGRLPMNEQD